MNAIRRRRVLGALGCAVIVAFVTAVLLVGLSKIFYPKNNQKSFGMTNEAANGILGERENSIDVLFIGDSEAYSSFSPLQMWESHGFTSYVCATGAQQLSYGNTLLHRATQNQRPRVVVIETHSAFAPVSVGEAILRTLQDVFPVLEFHNRWKSLTLDDFTGQACATYTSETKGFSVNTNVQAADASNYMAPSNDFEQISSVNRLYLQQMVQYCRSIGAVPVFVSTPSTVCWNMSRHNSMNAFARKLGVTYIDLNVGATKLDIDWTSETHDAGDHLNLAGAKKVSDCIGEYLSQSFDLPVHRKDASYKSWNEALERYKQLTNTERSA